jgi:hypothetical protein
MLISVHISCIRYNFSTKAVKMPRFSAQPMG